MGKVLRILVILMFLLGIGALVLSIMNFNKRELLVGRTHQLEEGYIQLAKTIESKDMPEVPQPQLPLRDISPVTSREMDNPEVSDFWDDYKHNLETPSTPIPMLDLGTSDNRLQLRQLYKIGADGKPEIDPLTGRPAQKGAGTMTDLMESTLKRAMAQSALLGTTRAELKKVREELAKTIDDANAVKKEGRKDKKTIETLNEQIAKLQEEKRQLTAKISSLESQIDDLNDEVAEAKLENEKLVENISDLERQVKKLNEDIQKLTARNVAVPAATGAVAGAPAGNMEGQLTPGDCGAIVGGSDEWKFVVVRLDNPFLDELVGPGRDQPMPQIELMVRRPGLEGPSGDFVTRIRLRQIIREKNLVIADILSSWQQAPVATGDVVYY